MSIMDIVAGFGYLIKALNNYGFTKVKGYEVSNTQVKFANAMLKDNIVEEIQLDNLVDLISKSSSEVISMIGVLEHLINPREILNAISRNKNVKYYYLSLPLFSYSVFWEMNNEEFF